MTTARSQYVTYQGTKGSGSSATAEERSERNVVDILAELSTALTNTGAIDAPVPSTSEPADSSLQPRPSHAEPDDSSTAHYSRPPSLPPIEPDVLRNMDSVCEALPDILKSAVDRPFLLGQIDRAIAHTSTSEQSSPHGDERSLEVPLAILLMGGSIWLGMRQSSSSERQGGRSVSVAVDSSLVEAAVRLAPEAVEERHPALVIAAYLYSGIAGGLTIGAVGKKVCKKVGYCS